METETTKFDLIENLIEELDDLRDDYGYDLNDIEKEILDNKFRGWAKQVGCTWHHFLN